MRRFAPGGRLFQPGHRAVPPFPGAPAGDSAVVRAAGLYHQSRLERVDVKAEIPAL